MQHYSCGCGASYRFPDEAVGKKARCKKCGAVFTLAAEEEGILAIAGEEQLTGESSLAAERAALVEAAVEKARAHASAAGLTGVRIEKNDDEAPAISVVRNFANDVLWSFLFPSSPGNLIAFVAIWIGLAVIAPIVSLITFIPYFGLLVLLMFHGWYAAFRFEVLRMAAAGQEDLPSVNFTDDLVDDFIRPLAQWIGSWLVVLLPAFIYLMYSASNGTITGMEAFGLITRGIATMLSGSDSELFLFDILVFAGLFLWPMVALCVALGGFPSLSRLDLILFTIAKTLPIYALLLVMLYGAIFLENLLLETAGAGVMGKAKSGSKSSVLGSALLLYALVVGAGIYLDIVLMRLIGLYYHHFKRRFAWDWG